jgi:hypothetical protein
MSRNVEYKITLNFILLHQGASTNPDNIVAFDFYLHLRYIMTLPLLWPQLRLHPLLHH